MPSQTSRTEPVVISDFEGLVELSAKNAACRVNKPQSPQPQTAQGDLSSDPKSVIEEIGDYLVLTARTWSLATEALVDGDHINQEIREVHERSKSRTQFSDLSAIASMDVKLSKLMKIRDLSRQFYVDVQSVWDQTPFQSKTSAS